jgi:transcriptional repressor NrdR
MHCPYCQHADTSVLDSRLTSTNDAIRRRRECGGCNKRFTTYERMELLDLAIVKKDGRSESFDRAKLLKGILRACEKRPVKRERVERAVDEIEFQLRQMDKTEVPSRIVGGLVSEKLKEMDEVAYVRFASVYRRFTDASQFAEEVAKLKNAVAPKSVGGKAKKVAATALV